MDDLSLLEVRSTVTGGTSTCSVFDLAGTVVVDLVTLLAVDAPRTGCSASSEIKGSGGVSLRVVLGAGGDSSVSLKVTEASPDDVGLLMRSAAARADSVPVEAKAAKSLSRCCWRAAGSRYVSGTPSTYGREL
jgi:hypothetical protein